MNMASVNQINFNGLNKKQNYKENPTTINFSKLSSDDKLDAIHERLVRLNKQLAKFEADVYNDNQILSQNQEKIQRFANYAAVCALYPPQNRDDADLNARNINIAAGKYYKVDVIV